MARRAIPATDYLGREHHQHNRFLDSHASKDREPWEYAIEAEEAEVERSDRPPTVIVMGCRPWPVPRDWPTRSGRMECGACHGNIRAPHFCAACGRPRGTSAQEVKPPKPETADKKLNGGTNRRAAG